MKVTQIEELSKARSKVYIDNEFAFVLYKGELRIYNIKENEEISNNAYNEIIKNVLPKRAKIRAMNLLTKRDYPTAKLRQKLKEGLYPDDVIEEALEYVASYNYTDDHRYALDYINYHENDKSRKRINQDLITKGISREIIDRAWISFEENGGHKNEEQMVRRILEKKNYFSNSLEYKEKQKIMASLLRKGFEMDTIKRVMLDIELF